MVLRSQKMTETEAFRNLFTVNVWVYICTSLTEAYTSDIYYTHVEHIMTWNITAFMTAVFPDIWHKRKAQIGEGER